MRRTLLLGLLTASVTCLQAQATPEQLLQAARTGNRGAAIALIRENTDVTATSADGTTALHWAVLHNDIDLVQALLASGADATATNRYGISPLYLAAQNGSAATIELLLDAGGSANEVGTQGETVLMTVARTGAVDAAKLLLERGAAVDARETWHGQTALMWAAGDGHAAMIELLTEHGADPNTLSAIEEWERQRTAEPRDKWLPPGGMSALLFAAREGCGSCITALAKAGADVDQTTPDGISAITLALINGHYDVAAALVEVGTDVTLIDYTGRTALYAAIDFSTMPNSNRPAPHVIENEHSALDVAALIIQRGADVNAQLTRLPPYRAKLDRGNDAVLGAGTTPLMRAAKAGDVPAIETLLSAGADPLLRTAYSERSGRGGVDALLLAAGVGTTEQDTTGRNKTQQQAIDAIRLLVANGADIHSTDGAGHNALHGAALQGYDDVIRFLASEGVDLKALDANGRSPLDTALGLAGGFGFAGNEGVVREDTAALIRELLLNSD